MRKQWPCTATGHGNWLLRKTVAPAGDTLASRETGSIEMRDRFSRRRRRILALATLWPVGIRLASAADEITDAGSAGDRRFIERAFAMRQHAIDAGDQPYGALVVRDGIIIAEAASRVVSDNDPTAHAEMEAIRRAARQLGTRNLAGCTLYGSSSACPMCESAAYWAGIERMVAGRDARDAGAPGLC